MGYDELLANVGGDSELERTLADYQKFAVVTVADGSRRIIAKTSVKLCKAQGCQGCSGLHLCKFYLFGDCRFNRTRGSGQYGACPDMANCRRLHICEKFLEGSCKQGTSCYKSHDLHTGEALKMLEDRGLTSELISSIQNVYLNKLNMKNGNIASTDKDKCFEAHHRMPYQWQVWDGLGWLDLTDNEQIEKEFCNPARTCRPPLDLLPDLVLLPLDSSHCLKGGSPFYMHLDVLQVLPGSLPPTLPSVAEVPAAYLEAHRVSLHVFSPALPGVVEALRSRAPKASGRPPAVITGPYRVELQSSVPVVPIATSHSHVV
ncbi:PAR12 polymerase, partial [Polypterus senegalus]